MATPATALRAAAGREHHLPDLPATPPATAPARVAVMGHELDLTDNTGPTRLEPHLVPMRSFFRCLISAQARALRKLESLCDRVLLSTDAQAPAFHRLYAVAHDLAAAQSAYARWKAACSLNWGHLGPLAELAEWREMLARSLQRDLELGALAGTLVEQLKALHDVIEARAAPAAADGARGRGAATAPPFAEARGALHVTAAVYGQLLREALACDSARLLVWVSRVFDRRLSEHAMQTLLYGPVVALRQVASVCRWALRNQSEPRAEQRFKAALAGGLGFIQAQDLLQYGRDAEAGGGGGGGSAPATAATSGVNAACGSEGGVPLPPARCSRASRRQQQQPRSSYIFAPSGQPLPRIAEARALEEADEASGHDESEEGAQGAARVDTDDDDDEEGLSLDCLRVGEHEAADFERDVTSSSRGRSRAAGVTQQLLAQGQQLLLGMDDEESDAAQQRDESLELAQLLASTAGGGGRSRDGRRSRRGPPPPPSILRQPTPVFHQLFESPLSFGAATSQGSGGSGDGELACECTPTTAPGTAPRHRAATGGLSPRRDSAGFARALSSDGSDSAGSRTPLEEGGSDEVCRGACTLYAAGMVPMARQLSEDARHPKHLRWEATGDDDGGSDSEAPAGESPALPPRVLPTLSQRMAAFRVGGVASHTLAITRSSSGSGGDDDSIELGLEMAGAASGGRRRPTSSSGGSSTSSRDGALHRVDIPGVNTEEGAARARRLKTAAAGAGVGEVGAGAGAHGSSAGRGRVLSASFHAAAPAATPAPVPAPNGALVGNGGSPAWFSRLFRSSHSHSPLLAHTAAAAACPVGQLPLSAYDARAYAPALPPRNAQCAGGSVPATGAVATAPHRGESPSGALPASAPLHLGPPPPSAELSTALMGGPPWTHATRLQLVPVRAPEDEAARRDCPHRDSEAAPPSPRRPPDACGAQEAAPGAAAAKQRGLLASCLSTMGCWRRRL